MAIDPHLQSMYNELKIPREEQAVLYTTGISDYHSLQANYELLRSGGLDRVAYLSQILIATAILYLKHISDSEGGDPLPQFTRRGWTEFIVVEAAPMIEALPFPQIDEANM